MYTPAKGQSKSCLLEKKLRMKQKLYIGDVSSAERYASLVICDSRAAASVCFKYEMCSYFETTE